MRLSIQYCIGIAILLILGVSTSHASPVNPIDSSVRFSVYTEHLPPLQIAKDGKLEGFAVDLAKMMLLKAGINAEVEVIPWGRAYKMAKEEANVILFSVVRKESREDLFHWIGPVFKDGRSLSTVTGNSEIFAWAKTSLPLRISMLDDLKMLTTCIAEHDSLSERVVKELRWPEKNVVTSKDWRSALEMFFADRCYLFISRIEYAKGLLEHNGYDISQVRPLISLSHYIPPPNFYFVLSKQTDSRWLAQLQQALQSVHRSKRYGELVRKWQLNFSPR